MLDVIIVDPSASGFIPLTSKKRVIYISVAVNLPLLPCFAGAGTSQLFAGHQPFHEWIKTFKQHLYLHRYMTLSKKNGIDFILHLKLYFCSTVNTSSIHFLWCKVTPYDASGGVTYIFQNIRAGLNLK